MSRSETLEALEDGLITEEEALEQGLVDSVDALHEQAASERGRSASSSGRGSLPSSRHHHS